MKRPVSHVFLGFIGAVAAVGVGAGIYIAFRAPSTDYDPNAPEPPSPVEPVIDESRDDPQAPVSRPSKVRSGRGSGGSSEVTTERRIARDGGRVASARDESDMRFLIDRVLSDSPFDDQPKALMELGKELAKRDFELAMRIALDIEDSRTRNALVRGILHAHAAVDPKTALAAALDLRPILSDGETPTLEYRRQEIAFRQALSAVISGWATTDPEGALAYVNEQVEDRYRGQSLNTIYRAWADVDPEAALASAAELDGWRRREVVQSIYREWGQSDPLAAISHASENQEDGRTKNEATSRILREWAVADLSVAVAWVERTTANREEAAGALRGVAYGLASEDPATAAELMGLYPELASSRGLASRVVREWSREDPAAAAEWTANITDANARGDAIKTTARNWAAQDLGQAFTWAQGLQDEQARAYALSNVALRQGEEAMDESTAWIQGLPQGFERDRTIAGYSLGVLRANKEYGAARQLQSVIGNESVDMQRVGTIVEGSNIPPEDKLRLQNMF